MELFKTIHLIAGIVVFITGLLQIVLRKSGPRHRLLGNIYVWTWFILLITGAIIGHPFITFLGIFGFYYALTGYRFAKLKTVISSVFDRALVITGFLSAICILVFAGIFFLGNNINFGIIFTVFGIIFALASSADVRKYVLGKRNTSPHKMTWYIEHYIRMIISYIAALTAFSSIQNIFNITLLNWLMPTVIGTTGIMIANRYYYKKFNIVKKTA